MFALVAAACSVHADGAQTEEDIDAQLARWRQAAASEAKSFAGQVFLPPSVADEWYTVTIAEVSVGYMNTAVTVTPETVSTMEVMDVQVSRGTDTSRMAFETVFTELPLSETEPSTALPEQATRGAVVTMAYDQRFANSEVKMSAAFSEGGISLTSYNGEKEHVSELGLPTEAWLGRMRARLGFTERCRSGEKEIVLQTMRPELGPRVVNLTSSFVGLGEVWDGEKMVEASHWSVQISDVPVNMSEAYPVHGPLACYRMLQMGLDMPFGHLLASLSSKEAALKAAEDDPSRKLPELVYTMFVPLSRPIPDVYEASMVLLQVRFKPDKANGNTLELPSAGYQKVSRLPEDPTQLLVKINLQTPRRASSAEMADTEFTSPSAMVDSSDDVVITLAHKVDSQLKALGHVIPTTGKIPPSSQIELVYALRDLVHNHISEKHLSTAYASASETARTGSGDCTEHAVLLAALLKARRVPARVCHGLVYVEQGGSAISGEAGGATVNADGSTAASALGQFGWHMWTQALVNGKWMDLDATLHVPYSVGHVLVGTSSMSDKEAHNNHMQMAALIGNLEIDLLEFSHEWRK